MLVSGRGVNRESLEFMRAASQAVDAVAGAGASASRRALGHYHRRIIRLDAAPHSRYARGS